MDLQKEDLDDLRLYVIENNIVPTAVLAKKNKAKTWHYGYNEKYDIVVISKDGTLGEVYNINGLKVGLPKSPSKLKKGSTYSPLSLALMVALVVLPLVRLYCILRQVFHP